MIAARSCPSPNHGERRGGATPSLVILHYTAMPSAEAALERLRDPVAEVSAHYLVARDGTLHRLVDEDRRAWHAGAGSWGGLQDLNSHSIGIELDNDGASPFAEALMASLEALLADLLERHGIAPQGIIAHSDMAPERKGDPGPRFDWRRLARQGLSVWPEPAATGPHRTFAKAAHAFGYPNPGSNAALDAFRLRFRPGAEGPADGIDLALARDLARRWPARLAAAD